ncbi:MAG: alkyl hydroperoxide reductase [Bacteroidetes bacterium]|nr:alkyl hydroperoxide reductase [Bacteroidota bacterium]
MKHYFTQIVAVIFLSSAAVAESSEGYNIKITAKGLKPSSMCQLARYYGDKQYIVDSAKVNDKGEVVFKGEEKWPQGIYLFVPPGKNKYFDFVMDEGQNFSIETDTMNFIKSMKVKGSEENKFFYEYQNFMSGKQKQIEPLQGMYKRLKDKNNDSLKIVQEKITEIDKEVKEYKLSKRWKSLKSLKLHFFQTVKKIPLLHIVITKLTFSITLILQMIVY